MSKGGKREGAGRPTGSVNKVTKELKEAFKELSNNNVDKVQGWLDAVASENPAEALKLYLSLSERVLGKQSSSNVDLTSNGETFRIPNIVVPPERPESEQETG